MELYVARDRRRPDRHDVGSVLCMQLLERLPREAVHVVDATHLHPRPSWLIGTPTLVADAGGDLWRGHQALTKLQSLAFAEAEGRRGSVAESVSHHDDSGRSSKPPDHSPYHEAKDDDDHDEEDDWIQASDPVPEEEDENDTFTRKLTSDDLSRALAARGGTSGMAGGGGGGGRGGEGASGPGPPPPTPLKD